MAGQIQRVLPAYSIMKLTFIICTLITCLLGCSKIEKAKIGAEPGRSSELQKGVSTTDAELYINPIDGQTYEASGPPCLPEGGVRRKSDRIQNVLLHFLIDDDAIAERTTVDSVVDFVERVEDTAQKALDPSTEQATVLAQFSCTPGNFSVELAHQGTLSEDLLNSFHEQLNKLEPLHVSSAEVIFQITIEIQKSSR